MKKINIHDLFGYKAKIAELKEEIECLKETNEEITRSLNKRSWDLLCDLTAANTEKLKALKDLEKLKAKHKEEKKELKAEIKELEKQLNESMSDKYKVKRVRASKPIKGQTIGIKENTLSNQTKKILKEKQD